MKAKVQRRPPTGTGASTGGRPPSKSEGGPGNAARAEDLAKEGTKGAGTTYPFLDQIQASFGGHDLGDIRAHTGPESQQAAEQMGAMGIAYGEDVAFAGPPDLFTAAHEAAHHVQQKAGEGPSGGEGVSGDRHEQHADAVAARVVAGQDASSLLDRVATPGQQSSGVAAVQRRDDPERKEVSATAMARLGHARRGIEQTKKVLSHGAGNQKEALKATNFNSYFRMAAMRDRDCWELDPALYDLADRYPDALTAAKADLAQGGNCGEHAMIAFDFLRQTAASETVNRCDVTDLDHAFVIVGDVASDEDDELVVCDPWPTAPTACLWEDHFAFTPDRGALNTRNSATGDDRDVKAAIAAGLRLSAKGQEMIQYAYDDARTQEEIDKGTEGDHPWIWTHPNAASEEFDYHTAPEEAPEQAPEEAPEQAPESSPQVAADPGYSRFLSWLRSVLGIA